MFVLFVVCWCWLLLVFFVSRVLFVACQLLRVVRCLLLFLFVSCVLFLSYCSLIIVSCFVFLEFLSFAHCLSSLVMRLFDSLLVLVWSVWCVVCACRMLCFVCWLLSADVCFLVVPYVLLFVFVSCLLFWCSVFEVLCLVYCV